MTILQNCTYLLNSGCGTLIFYKIHKPILIIIITTITIIKCAKKSHRKTKTSHFTEIATVSSHMTGKYLCRYMNKPSKVWVYRVAGYLRSLPRPRLAAALVTDISASQNKMPHVNALMTEKNMADGSTGVGYMRHCTVGATVTVLFL